MKWGKQTPRTSRPSEAARRDRLDKRAAIFAALAQGLDLPGVRERFDLTPEALQELFRDAADLYRDRGRASGASTATGPPGAIPGPPAPG